MIAHSFKGKDFGPAQNLHGATYTVDVEISTQNVVDEVNWVIDIGLLGDYLSDVLKKYNFKHLNEIFPEDNTTTEFMCRIIHKDLASKINGKCSGNLRVKLFESHKAWASYSGEL
jgi:6-pyruvoyl-tetrahydropterin synthase